MIYHKPYLRGHIVALLLFVHIAYAKEAPLSLNIQFVTPQTLSQQEVQQHMRIASDSFYIYDSTLGADVGPKKFYDEYFENFFKAFMNQKDQPFFLLSAYDSQRTLIGGMYGKILFGPHHILGLEEKQKAYCISCIYVDSAVQNRGIATALVSKLIMQTEKEDATPIFLYTYAVHTKARNIYEKCGFHLMTDKDHPNGEWSLAAEALLFGDRCFVAPVAYRKN